KDGTVLPVELREFLIKDEEGNNIGTWAFVRDITDRKKAGEVIKNNISLLSATVEATADGIIVRDLSGDVVTYNRRFVEMWRLPDASIMSRDFDQIRSFVTEKLKDPETFLRISDLPHLQSEAESCHILELKDGRVFERISKPQKVGGKTVGRVISMRDITEHRDLEAQLRHAQKMEVIGRLAGGISHDFNNILSVIMGLGSMAIMHLADGDPLRAQMKQILAAASRGAHLTRSLLAFSRKQNLNPQQIDLNQIVRNLENFLRMIIRDDI